MCKATTTTFPMADVEAATSGSGHKKSVSFSSGDSVMSTIHEHYSLDELSFEEKRQLWYTGPELIRMSALYGQPSSSTSSSASFFSWTVSPSSLMRSSGKRRFILNGCRSSMKDQQQQRQQQRNGRRGTASEVDVDDTAASAKRRNPRFRGVSLFRR